MKTSKNLRERVERELLGNILPFWLKHSIDNEYGGFRGQVTNDLKIDPLANKGLILNARILWTFSKAHTFYKNELYLRTAQRAYEYLLKHFWDPEFGGMYWIVDYRGKAVDTRKRIYGQAFALYALAEYASSCAEEDPLLKAVELYRLIEETGHDQTNCGYFETYDRDWKLAREQRLSDVDMDEKKSMNTHLHILEAYTNLLRHWEEPKLRMRLRELLRIFLDRIIDNETHHFRMFFDEQWNDRSKWLSYGHDIEGSWLICSAAEVLGDPDILRDAQNEAVKMAQAVYEQAVDIDGGLFYEGVDREIIDRDKHWWPQAEAVVGFLNAHQLSGEKRFLQASEQTWAFIENHLVDRKFGEWYWKVSLDGRPTDNKYKVDLWKCPYHNSRACFEVMERLDRLTSENRI